MQDWTTGVHDWHNVNLSQGFREPGVYYQQAQEERFLRAAENNYQTIMGLYGQFPGGGFAGDENCRPGYTDPRQGFETCGMVEFMHSFEMLTKISGNPLWADRCEDIAVNSLPASLTPDLKGLHYLTCANQVQLDKEQQGAGDTERRHDVLLQPVRASTAAASTTCRTAGPITRRNSGWRRRTAACALRFTPPAK